MGLGDAAEQQRQEREQHVGADAVFFSVVDRAQVEDVLLVAPAVLDLDQLLVVDGDLVGGEVIVGGGEQELAIEVGVGLDLGAVDHEPAVAAGDVAAHARGG